MKTTKMQAEFANAAASQKAQGLILFVNDITVGADGWAQIAPYGDFVGKALIPEAAAPGGWRVEKAIQRMDQAAAVTMVNEYQEHRKGLSRFLKSRPIYHGHPDSPVGGQKYPNKNPIGVFANLRASESGMDAELVLTEEGEELVATKQVRAPSTRWTTELVGEENGMKVYRPDKLYSIGLVPQSNLPVQMLNEAFLAEGPAAAQPQETTMNKKLQAKLMAWLTKMGIQFANDAATNDAAEVTDEQFEAAVAGLAKKADLQATFANEKATLQATIATRDGQIATLTTNATALTTERDTARTQFANERRARIGDLVAEAITAGRITAAEQADWERRLGVEAQFANEAAAIAKLESKVKTTSVTLQRGDRKVEISNADQRREMVQEMVNEEMTAGKCDYDTAFGRVQRKCPQLFAAMQAPEIKARKSR